MVVVGACGLLIVAGMAFGFLLNSWLGAILVAFAVMSLLILVYNSRQDFIASVEWTAGAHTDAIAFSNDVSISEERGVQKFGRCPSGG
jgi:hypothetical protein